MFTRSLSDGRDRSPSPNRLNQSWKVQGWTSGTAGSKRTFAARLCFRGSSLAGLGGCRDPRGPDHRLEELACFSSEASPSPGSAVVPDQSANPFHVSGDLDFFLLRDQERNKSLSVSICRGVACLQLLPPSHGSSHTALCSGHCLTLE